MAIALAVSAVLLLWAAPVAGASDPSGVDQYQEDVPTSGGSSPSGGSGGSDDSRPPSSSEGGGGGGGGGGGSSTGSGGSSTGSSGATAPAPSTVSPTVAGAAPAVKKKIKRHGGKDKALLERVTSSAAYGAPTYSLKTRRDGSAASETSSLGTITAVASAVTGGSKGRLIGLLAVLVAVSGLLFSSAAARGRSTA